ncbi:DUF3558 family protein [Saccharopolyspora hordei]|uniref:DUF3558 domain-containing protein n=1 Tax=Saccharopolyspora hordei TaxID=1838 RepID=A0A853AJY2_9PSEU|nr:DUF3558 family protein [Saccharopolyspora hordei]NYI82563.1 hypothetical protein [Saccharopolyspora hordei]
MRKTRLAVAVAGTAAGLLLAGCASGGGNDGQTTAPEQKNVLANVDPCNVLSADELQQLGVTEPGEPVDQGVGEQGCDFDADSYAFAIYKGENDSLAYWKGQRDNFAIFEENKVGSRNGIKQVTKGAVGQSTCNQVIEVGSGSVTVQFGFDADNKQSDEATCAKAMEIAQLVEPKLPK